MDKIRVTAQVLNGATGEIREVVARVAMGGCTETPENWRAYLAGKPTS